MTDGFRIRPGLYSESDILRPGLYDRWVLKLGKACNQRVMV